MSIPKEKFGSKSSQENLKQWEDLLKELGCRIDPLYDDSLVDACFKPIHSEQFEYDLFSVDCSFKLNNKALLTFEFEEVNEELREKIPITVGIHEGSWIEIYNLLKQVVKFSDTLVPLPPKEWLLMKKAA